MKLKCERETFFHVDGKRYKTKNRIVDVPTDIADKLIESPIWSKVKTKKVNKNGNI